MKVSRIILLAVLIALTSCLYQNNPNVQKINLATYQQIQSGIWLVVFYKHTCSTCQHFAPKFQQAANALKGIVRAAAFDCVTEKPPGLALPHVPRVKLFVDGKVTAFKGPYNSRAVVNFAVNEFGKVIIMIFSWLIPDFLNLLCLNQLKNSDLYDLSILRSMLVY